MSVDLEKLERLRAEFDSAGMLDLVSSFPEQMADAWEIGAAFAAGMVETPGANVVVCGMGGSAIGGDMVRSFMGNALAVPLVVNRGYGVAPSLIKDGVFVFSSYSGNTAETLSAYDSVRGTGRPSVAITSGGELARRCREDGVPVCEIPGGMPPRAAIAYSFFPLAHILNGLGLGRISEGEYEEARAALVRLCREYRSPGQSNRAAAIAFELFGKLPFVYSGTGLLEAVSRRWSTQLNENSKSLAHFAHLPELTHNEIVGWEALEALRQNIAVVYLEDSEDGETARKQADIALEIIKPHGAGVIRVSAGDGARLTRVLSTMILGDFVSVYLAFLNGADPTPVENIDTLKRRLR
jgi:glucose/mannose-6-phosphate isomerase